MHTWKGHYKAHDATGVAHLGRLPTTNNAKNNSRLNISQTMVEVC
jgi:hypothetical protein